MSGNTAALTLTPMLCSRMLKQQRNDSPLFKKIYGPIERVLDKIDDGFTLAAFSLWSLRGTE